MKPVQTFSDEYLAQCRQMTPDQVIRFLEDFRRLQAARRPPDAEAYVAKPGVSASSLYSMEINQYNSFYGNTSMTTHPATDPSPSAVLTKAVTRAATQLGLSRALLARILGVSPATVTRLYSGAYQLDEQRKEWEFALLFVRAFRSLDSIVGDEQTARQWLNSENRALNARPVDLLRQAEGLVRVVHYLDASRGIG